jgi:hypothetical protein
LSKITDEKLSRCGLSLIGEISNEKIKWIIEDEDVKEFIGTLYKAKSELVKDDVAEFLKEIFK